MLMQVKVIKTRPNAKLPTYGSNEAAGADVYASLPDSAGPIVEIKPHETVLIPLGIKTEFTPGYGAFLYGRSGLCTKKGLAPANKVGVIDSDYRGEWMIALHNHSNITQFVEDGERVGQVVFKEIERPEYVEADNINDTNRGEGGFGSTGSK